MRSALLLSLIVVGLAAVSFGESAPSHRLSQPPEDCAVVRIAGRIYAVGEIYLSAHADTARLTPFGFRRYEFRGWSLGRARYAAVWPLNVSVDALPSQLDELSYETIDVPDPAAVEELSGQPGGDDPLHRSSFQNKLERFFESEETAPAGRFDGQGSGESREVVRDVDGQYYYDLSQVPGGYQRADGPSDLYRPPYGGAHSFGSYDDDYSGGSLSSGSRLVVRDRHASGTLFSTSESRTTLGISPIQQWHRQQATQGEFHRHNGVR